MASAPKVLVAARIDDDWLMKYGKGYSTRINGILRTVAQRTGSFPGTQHSALHPKARDR
jgi:uncharacterized protein (DUF4415 family)